MKRLEKSGDNGFLYSNVENSPDLFRSAAMASPKGPISKEDGTILRELSLVASEGRLPEWWTEQETAYLSTCPPEKAARYVIYRYKFQVYPTTKTVPDFPTYVLVEPVSSCNLRCPMCFQTDKTFTRKPYMGVMSFDLFRAVIDECHANHTGAITLASRGEPLLHPEFDKMLAYLKEKFFEIKINTNGTALTERLCHAILENEVNNIVFSIDAGDKSTYEKLRFGARFEDTLEGVKMFSRIRRESYPSSKTRVRVSGVKVLELQDVNAFRELWRQHVDEVTIFDAQMRWDTYNNPVNSEMTSPCGFIWERFYVWFDGTCNPCDVDYKSKLSPGTYGAGTSIRDIWHSQALNRLRAAHLANERTKIEPCDRCGVA